MRFAFFPPFRGGTGDGGAEVKAVPVWAGDLLACPLSKLDPGNERISGSVNPHGPDSISKEKVRPGSLSSINGRG